MIDPALDATARASLALLFASSAAHKLGDPVRFRDAVRDYRVLPGAAVPVGAGVLVVGEIGTAMALVVPTLRVAAFVTAAVLLSLYAGAIGVNLVRGRVIECGCGGPVARRPISGWLVARNLVLAAVALFAAAPVGSRPLLWVDALTIGAATLALAAAYATLDRLIGHAPVLGALRETR